MTNMRAYTLKPVLKNTDSESNCTPDLIFYCDERYEYIISKDKNNNQK